MTMVFDNKSFGKFTTALGRKLSDGRLFFTKLFLIVQGNMARSAKRSGGERYRFVFT